MNGRIIEIGVGGTLAQILSAAGFGDTRGMAVAVNGDVVSRSEWETWVVDEGARIEVVRAVQGG